MIRKRPINHLKLSEVILELDLIETVYLFHLPSVGSQRFVRIQFLSFE